MSQATLSFSAEMDRRLERLLQAHSRLFSGGGRGELVISRAPGRAEILGNHTDYNEGYTLSANVQHSVLMVARRRNDDLIRISSLNRDGTVVEMRAGSARQLLENKLSGTGEWANYPAGVVWSFLDAGLEVGGFDAVLEGNIPPGGLSASAALELATGHALMEMYELSVPPATLVQLCHAAEASYVGVPCGYLDQATVGLADSALLMSYRPVDGVPFTYQPVDFGLAEAGWQLVVGYDPESGHTLTDGRYAARRQVCERSVPVLREVLGRSEIRALRDVASHEVDAAVSALQSRVGPLAVDYVTHVVTENERVLAGHDALRQRDFVSFGSLMTESGSSAINRYGLDDGSPELRFFYETARAYAETHDGVAGVRNMGGGFNATTLTLVRAEDFEDYAGHMTQAYARQFGGRRAILLPFTPARAAGVIRGADRLQRRAAGAALELGIDGPVAAPRPEPRRPGRRA